MVESEAMHAQNPTLRILEEITIETPFTKRLGYGQATCVVKVKGISGEGICTLSMLSGPEKRTQGSLKISLALAVFRL